MLLADAAVGISRRFRPTQSLITVGRQLAARPDVVARHATDLARQLGDVVAGRSDLAPGARDRRFADPAWTNPVLRRVLQAYLATATTAEHVVVELGLEGREDERVRLAVSNLIVAAAPSNNPLLNPTAIKELVDTGGASAVRGARASSPTWPPSRGCRGWSNPMPSRSAATSPRRRKPSFTASSCTN